MSTDSHATNDSPPTTEQPQVNARRPHRAAQTQRPKPYQRMLARKVNAVPPDRTSLTASLTLPAARQRRTAAQRVKGRVPTLQQADRRPNPSKRRGHTRLKRKQLEG